MIIIASDGNISWFDRLVMTHENQIRLISVDSMRILPWFFQKMFSWKNFAHPNSSSASHRGYIYNINRIYHKWKAYRLRLLSITLLTHYGTLILPHGNESNYLLSAWHYVRRNTVLVPNHHKTINHCLNSFYAYNTQKFDTTPVLTQCLLKRHF